MRLLLRFFGLLFAAGTIIFVAAIAAAAGLLWHYSQSLPDYSQLQDYEPAVMTRVHASDGSLLAEYARERRLYIPIQAVPKLVIHAFVALKSRGRHQPFIVRGGGQDISGTQVARPNAFPPGNPRRGQDGVRAGPEQALVHRDGFRARRPGYRDRPPPPLVGGVEAAEEMGDDPLRIGRRAQVVADGRRPRQLVGGTARQVHGLRADLIRFPGPKWAHVQ